MDPLCTADIERRRSRLLASVFLLLGAFATLSVVMSLLDADALSPLRLAPTAARYGVLALALGFVALVVERDRALRVLAARGERQRILMASLQNRLEVLESLLEAGDRLNAPLMVHDVLDVLLDSAISLTGAPGGSVATVVGDDDGEIKVARRHSMTVAPAALEFAELVDFPLTVGDREIGVLQLALPFDTEDPVLAHVLERFTERAAIALERAQLMAKERASAAYLRAANVVKSRFLQTVSHELRTPLTSIIGYSRTLEHHWEKLPDETKLEFARSINEQGGRMKILIERILEAARVELAGVTVRPLVHDVRRSVERGLSEFPHDSGRIALALPDEEVTAEVDPFVVEQSVQNLVDNALLYSAGEVRVSLDHYRDSVVITVTDSGPGMNQSDLDLVVQPLGRIEENVNSGTGLGLHIVRTLVADHGGRLELASSPSGTTIQVSLPRGAASRVPHASTLVASSS